MGLLMDYKQMQCPILGSKLIIYGNNLRKKINNVHSINFSLSKELIAISPQKRTIQLERCLCNIVSGLPSQPVIGDIDVMFNPDYKIDVMNVLVTTYKKTPFTLIWPGDIDGNRLTYSEYGRPDYKTYSIEDYDIICVK